MKNGTDSQKPSLSDRIQQLGSLAGFIVDFLATILSYEQVKYWLEHKTELKKNLIEAFKIVDEYADTREEWQEFYKIKFGWDVDFSRVIIPTMPIEGKWRLLILPRRMGLDLAFEACTKLFKTCRYNDNLDGAVTENIRTTSDHYAVWVRDEIEPDKEFLGKSTRQADPDMKIGVTLLERIIFEIKYFTETGKHLDVKGLTFCSGSRPSVGLVPCADWYGDKFRVDWSGLDNSDSGYGIRSAVAL